jgi:hypothetical protein
VRIDCRKQLFSAYVIGLVLRSLLNSTLPIEIVYNGQGEDQPYKQGLQLYLSYICTRFSPHITDARATLLFAVLQQGCLSFTAHLDTCSVPDVPLA